MPTTMRCGSESKPQVGQLPLWGHHCLLLVPNIMSGSKFCDMAIKFPGLNGAGICKNVDLE